MDEYAYAYVNEHARHLESLRTPSPAPLPAKARILGSPPHAILRRRAQSTSIPSIGKAATGRDATDFEARDRDLWYCETDASSSGDEGPVDYELLTLRDANHARLVSCRKILESATSVLERLDSISSGFDTVKDQTSSLQTACSELQSDQNRLSAMADGVRETLQPFSHLATANRLLNVPGSNIVLQPSFQDLLQKLQSSLDFFSEHQDYRDAELYMRQYRQAMTKALALVRVHFSSSMRDIASDISNRIQMNAMNKNTQSALLYTKFRATTPSIRPLMETIEAASIKHDEYNSLLSDCWHAYFGIRKKLVSPMITATFQELSTISEFATFCTSSISFVRALAIDERELYHSFFQSGEEEFESYLGYLGSFFTDALRPRIAAESSLTNLCEVCSGMQAQCLAYADDQLAITIDMTPVLSTPMGEIQRRIVLKAQGVVMNEIQGYKPSDKDLDYPGSLTRAQVPRRTSNGASLSVLRGQKPYTPQIHGSPARQLLSASSVDDLESLNSVVLHERWYITLRVSISLLSKIYKLVQSSIFDDLAHEVVRSCIASLLYASNLIRRRSYIDGQLFFLKHILILKDQIAEFDIEVSGPAESSGLDVSQFAGAFWGLTQQTAAGLFAPTALYNLASSTLSKLSAAGYLSRTVENMSDAREELDDQTRLAIGSLTLHCADSVTVPLRSVMGNKSREAKELSEANRKLRASCPDSFSLWRHSFELYLEDDRVVSALLGIVQDKVLETYERFDHYIEELKKQKTLNMESAALGLPTVIETVDWLNSITESHQDSSPS